jgi:ATP phosphoribosyltransferase
MPIRIALPKGRLLNETARLAAEVGWQISDYSEGTRLYHLTSARYPDLSGKIFHEKDIPIQVAMGNYDLGICSLDWIQELLVKYPGSNLVKIKDLGYGRLSLFLAASSFSSFSNLEKIQNSRDIISIASEYPNLAESTALNCRFKRFNIFPVWGAAEIYPPENADLVLISANTEKGTLPGKLTPVAKILDSSAFLIANRISLETKDLSLILDSIQVKPAVSPLPSPSVLSITAKSKTTAKISRDSIRLALPDGHQQKHMVNVFNKARIKIEGYPSESGDRRPEIDLPGFSVKVVRPQDMPLQIANGNFDAAVTGKDWVKEHRYQFPASPIVELADLKYGLVRIVVAVHNDLPVNDTAALRQMAREKGWNLRLASEYVRIADKYARDNHLGRYRIIPTWGATEAFLPDDADILIENTETGSTLKRHNLKIIETLFESSACLVANAGALESSKGKSLKMLAAALQKAVEEG